MIGDADSTCLACGMRLQWSWHGRRRDQKVWMSDAPYGARLTEVCEATVVGHVPKSEPEKIEQWLAS